MQKDILNAGIKQDLTEFVNKLREICGTNLKSVILYGGYAKNDFTPGKSNVNLLFVFDHVDLAVMDQLSVPFQVAMASFKMSPFILTTSEIKPSCSVFAVKLFDISSYHQVLYGEDNIASLDFNPEHLRFISEQELRNQLARLKFFYIQHFDLPEQLYIKVQRSFTTLLINANMFLYLKHKTYYATRTEIVGHLLDQPEMDKEALQNLLVMKDREALPETTAVRGAYDQLMIQYKQLIKAFKELDRHG